MIKKTVYIANPVHLHLRNGQLVLDYSRYFAKEVEEREYALPIEDIGVLMLDGNQITLTVPVLQALLGNNVAVIVCDDTHHPQGMFLNLNGHTRQSERFRYQTEAGQPLKKQLWQQTIRAKITNQAALLRKAGHAADNLEFWASHVRSGDPEGLEARAAAYYWKNIFASFLPDFYRRRDGPAPNHLLNYAYSLIRATVARGLTGSGLLPTLGIFHRNQYNAYCLADDIMEPYRPFADELVLCLIKEGYANAPLDRTLKQRLLELLVTDVWLQGQKSPLMVAISRSTASLAQCYTGETRQILYPQFMPQ